MDSGYGFKALDPTGATYPDNRRDGSGVMLYALPRPDEKWGPWMDHPNPAEPDGRECGHGRFHIWSSLSLEYGPRNPWPWFVQWEVKIGGDGRKLGVRRLRLRRISPRVLARSLRSPFNWGFGACLSNICLSGANLYAANLRDADLSGANLGGANLRDADLSGAKLRDANLSGANLRDADLSGAKLRDADLSGAKLRDANLSGANLGGANLRGADLSDANLRGANLSDANLRDADLSDANLRDAIANEYTSWTTDIPDGVTVLQNR